ncbi:maltose regulon repressor [Salmonella enterica subsp. arizonae]|uniref:Maltose regulon repressor n=1 Tax=Salmonella enterica subsp. arizonae TaxID=59203 RepID=A0A3S4G3H1_SALER|nr:maltose regulon repressor [Salmonella enterica subsp. arizonae]
MVIAGVAGSSEALRAQADAQGIPVVFASRASYLDDADIVRPDNMQAVQLLTEYLIRQGHQRIAWLGGQSASLTRAERVAAIARRC